FICLSVGPTGQATVGTAFLMASGRSAHANREAPMYRRKIQMVICVLLIALVSVASAQERTTATKRALTHNDYDSWKSIQSQKLSRDGKFLVYALTPQDGDGEL